MANKHKGTTFDNFLEEEALFEEVEAIAIKRVVAYELDKIMRKKNLNKMQMAQKMRTSRSALNRLLDPENTAVTLQTLVKAAYVLGKKIQVSFAKDPKAKE